MSYQSLFGITVRHAFFSVNAGPSLTFLPTPRTGRVIHNAGLLIRTGASRLVLCYDADSTEALRLFLAEAEDNLDFDFNVYARDPYFENYTDIDSYPAGSIPCFNSRLKAAVPEREGFGARETQSVVMAAEVSAPDEERFCTGLSREYSGHGPIFRVTIGVRGQWLDIDTGRDRGAESREYVVSFESRKTYWKYCVFGEVADAGAQVDTGLRIVDLGGDIQFQAVGRQALFPDRAAMVFYSNKPVALRDRPENRFQLRRQGSSGEKVLVKRLANASPGNLYREVIDGEMVYVSEIYVNY